MNAIEQLYYGKIYAEEWVCPKTAEYRKAVSDYVVARDMLMGSLEGRQRQVLEDLIAAEARETDQLCLELFRQGMILGAKLQRELLELE